VKIGGGISNISIISSGSKSQRGEGRRHRRSVSSIGSENNQYGISASITSAWHGSGSAKYGARKWRNNEMAASMAWRHGVNGIINKL